MPLPTVLTYPLPASFSPTAYEGSTPVLLAATLRVPEFTSRVATLKSAPLRRRPVVCSHWVSPLVNFVSPVPGLAAKVVAVTATRWLTRLPRPAVFHAPAA